MFADPHAYSTGAVRPGAVELVIFLPPGVYAQWMREVGFPFHLRDLYDARPDQREMFERQQEDHLSKVQEHLALVVMARVIGTGELLPSADLEAYLRAEWGLDEVPYEVESLFPFVLLHDVPAEIRELHEAGDIHPHEFTWEPGP